MLKTNDSIGKSLKYIIFSSIVYWMISLLNTDSYYIIYLLIGIYSSYKILVYRDLINKKHRVITIIFSLTLSMCVALANYSIIESYFKFVILVIIGIIVFYLTLDGIYNSLDKIKDSIYGENRINKRKVFIYTFILICIVDLVFLFFVQYPCSMSSDTNSQLWQIIQNSYSNHHPFVHTMIIKVFYDLGMSLFGDINKSLALYSIFQIVSMSFIFSFANVTLYELGVTKWVNIVFILFFALMPYNIFFSVSIWKDIPFGIIVLLFVVSILRITKDIGNRKINYILLFISSIGFCLLRSNGWYAFIVTFVIYFFIFYKTNKKILIVLLASLIVSCVVKYPIMNKLNVEQPDLVENLSIPIQQISRVVVDCNDLNDDEYELLSKIVNVDDIDDNYVSYISDNMKNLIRNKNNLEYLSKNIEQYVHLYIKLGLRHPITYINAWVDQTKGYFNGGYDYWITSREVYGETLGVYKTTRSSLLESIYTACKSIIHNSELTKPLVSIGLHSWLVILVLYIGIMKKNIESCYLVIPLFFIILSLLIATPVYCEFRYAYAIFTSIYFVLVSELSFHKQKK